MFINFKLRIKYVLLGFVAGYMVCFGLERMGITLLFTLLAYIVVAAALIFSVLNLHRTQSDLIKRGFFKDVVFNIAVVQNGLAFFALWVGVVCLQQFNIVLVFEADLLDQTATTISYTLLLLDLIIYFSLDNFLFTKSLRYIFAPYAGLVWYLLGVLVQHWDEEYANSIYGLVLICLTLVAIVTKAVLAINRARDEPTLGEGYQRI